MKEQIIAVVGLGYVGLPLALEFGKYYETIGFDVDENKIDQYRKNVDPNNEVETHEFEKAIRLHYTESPNHLNTADYIIVTVPTPVDETKKPDFSPLLNASKIIGENMKKGTTIIYESTVNPGATEEICIPQLEKYSGLRWKQDFSVGYSPERINPGDRKNKLTNIKKVVSGDTVETLEKVATLYSSIIVAGVHKAKTIKVAEASKILENTQRDVNIALMNEVAIIFSKLGVSTKDVLEAASTKWNFLPFKPGLVGGHCISVDPYYLTSKAEEIGVEPNLIAASRKVNESVPGLIADQVKNYVTANLRNYDTIKLNVLGLTFKENCNDTRNSKVFDLLRQLSDRKIEVNIWDPQLKNFHPFVQNQIVHDRFETLPTADVLILAVPHDDIISLGIGKLKTKIKSSGMFYDLKSAFNPELEDLKDLNYLAL